MLQFVIVLGMQFCPDFQIAAHMLTIRDNRKALPYYLKFHEESEGILICLTDLFRDL